MRDWGGRENESFLRLNLKPQASLPYLCCWECRTAAHIDTIPLFNLPTFSGGEIILIPLGFHHGVCFF